MRKPIYLVGGLALGLLMYSCASIGHPSGGPRDEDPPRYVKATPAPGSVNVDVEKVTIDFNELVNVKDAYTKVVISPPSRNTPRVTSQGKRVTVSFSDSLKPNTTYTIDFADAIEDNNEGNKLNGFTYTFSTGAEIDTMMISGMVLAARNSEPQKGMLVGVHSDLNDSAFLKKPFDRVARTDDRGRFTVRGLKSGLYRVYALEDKDNDYMWSSPEEIAGVWESIAVPSSYPEEVLDTVWNLKTGDVDTVLTRQRTVFTPNQVLIRSFDTERKPQYIADYQRQDSTKLLFRFNTRQSQPPRLELLNDIPGFDSKYVLERSLTNDTLTYWLRDPELIKTDTLRLSVTYERLDSAFNPVAWSDTLQFVTNRPKPVKKKATKNSNRRKVESITTGNDSIAAITLKLTMITNSSQDVNYPVVFEAERPVAHIDTSALRLLVKRDTNWVAVPRPWRLLPADSAAVRRWRVEYPWDYATEYRLEADTMAFTGIYGKPSRPLTHDFRTKSEDSYCALTFNITGFSSEEHTFVELLNTSDEVVRTAVVEDGEAYFPFLAPGKYYARIIEDFNGNGRFDTGDPSRGLRPDASFYYPKAINLKQNWDKSEQWDVFATAIDLQKPDAIKKNKPETPRNLRGNSGDTEEEEEDDYFDPNRNPFDPNDRGSRGRRNY